MAGEGHTITGGPAKWAMVGGLTGAALASLAWFGFTRTPAGNVVHVPPAVVAPAEPVLVARPQAEPPVNQQPVAIEVTPAPALPVATLVQPLLAAPEPRVVDRSPHGPFPGEAPTAEPTKTTQPAPVQPLVGESPKPAPAAPKPAPAGVAGGRRININTATKAELELLPGIGPALADRLIDARSKKRFAGFEDLDAVRGIGPKMLEKLRPHVAFQDEPSPR